MSPRDPAQPQVMLKSELPGHLIRHATLRQLQVFEAIVRLGSFTQAAEELYLTQPTVSIQIKKLSDALGMPLFEQIGRKVFPTEVGHALYGACREILGSLSNLEMKLAELHGLKRGRLRLAVITTASTWPRAFSVNSRAATRRSNSRWRSAITTGYWLGLRTTTMISTSSVTFPTS